MLSTEDEVTGKLYVWLYGTILLTNEMVPHDIKQLSYVVPTGLQDSIPSHTKCHWAKGGTLDHWVLRCISRQPPPQCSPTRQSTVYVPTDK